MAVGWVGGEDAVGVVGGEDAVGVVGAEDAVGVGIGVKRCGSLQPPGSIPHRLAMTTTVARGAAMRGARRASQ